MKNLLWSALLVCAAVVSGCGPSIDPAAKADIDRRIATLSAGGPSFPAPAAFITRPFVVGQWTQHKVVDADGHPAFMTYKIVGEDSGAFWVETVHEAYTGKTVTKMLAFFGDRMNPQAIEIRAVKLRDKNGRVTDYPPQLMSLMQSTFRSALSGLVVSWQGQPQEDVAVPAGSFAGCFKVRSDVSWGPWHGSSMTWSHPAVPITGMVRSQGIDKPTTMELVAFGETGAVSELP